MSNILLLRILKRVNFLFGDTLYLRLFYYFAMGKKLDLENPKTMNEKLQYLKLKQREPMLTSLVDKIAVKNIVAEKIGQEYVCPLLGVWDSFDEIDFDALPDSFVLKTNHSGGNTGVVICKDKKSFDVETARKKLTISMKEDIYPVFREWPYKNVKKRIFAEKFLGENLVDYKFYCFNGDADCVLLCIDRQKGSPKFYFFDRDWNLLRYNKRGKAAPEGFTLPKPDNMDLLFHLASKMSEGFPFVRMDFFDVDGKCYFGEYTFYPASGVDENRLPETDRYFGDKIDLSLCGQFKNHFSIDSSPHSSSRRAPKDEQACVGKTNHLYNGIRYVLQKVLFRLTSFFSDEQYLRLQFYLTMGRRLDLEHPRTMDEKLQWLKLHQHDRKYTNMVDKLAVKDIVSSQLGEQHVARVLAVWDNVDDIDISQLPNQFVLKTTHSGGNTGVAICSDKSAFNLKKAKAKLAQSMRFDIYPRYREWPYKDVPRKVFAEEYLGDNLTDYKVYCFDGDADCVLVCVGRQKHHTRYYFFDKEWKLCPYNSYALEAGPNFTLPKPPCIDRVFEMASSLSKGYPFIRIDFYDINGRVYFGEYTFYPSSGYHTTWLPGTDEYFGEKINLGLCEDSGRQ